MERFVVVIPARMASARLPDKPLLDIGGRPMIAWVHARAGESSAAEVVVATDDERIAAVCRSFGADVEMTAASHASGTDRIAEVAERRGWDDGLIVVNVQGDEPLLPPALVDQAAALLAAHPEAGIATLTAPIVDDEDFRDPNVVKVAADRAGFALYFSRAPIPAARDGRMPPDARRHVGLYAYRAESLKALARCEPCALERVERLEQLRALWMGQRIVLAEACEPPPRGVDTPRDLDAIRARVADGDYDTKIGNRPIADTRTET